MNYFTVIIYAADFDRFYIGQIKDLTSGLARHNNQTEPANSPYIPWQLIWFASKSSRSDAMVLEKKLKNLTKTRLKKFILKYSDNKP